MLSIGSSFAPGVAHHASASAGAEEPRRHSLDQPRLGRNLSGLTAHHGWQTPLQHAVTTLAGRIAAPDRDGARHVAGTVNKDSLENYVRATLGMPHDDAMIDSDLAPYLDELSRNESTDGAQPITRDSFVLLCILHLAGQVPGPAEYGQLSRHAFVGWLNEQLGPGTVRGDLIPDEYFASVKVVTPETAFPNRCAVSYGLGLADEAPVQAMLPFDLRHRVNRPGFVGGSNS